MLVSRISHSRLRSGRASLHEARLKISCNRNPFLLISHCLNGHCDQSKGTFFWTFQQFFFITRLFDLETCAFWYTSKLPKQTFLHPYFCMLLGVSASVQGHLDGPICKLAHDESLKKVIITFQHTHSREVLYACIDEGPMTKIVDKIEVGQKCNWLRWLA